MTEEKHEHLQGVIFIRSRDPDYNYCYLLPRRYNITPQSKCNCNQETTGQTTAADLDQETRYTKQTTTTVSANPDRETSTTEQTTSTASTYPDQETTEQITDISSVHLNQESMISLSCKVAVERMLPLFCSLICLIFVIILNNH